MDLMSVLADCAEWKIVRPVNKGVALLHWALLECVKCRCFCLRLSNMEKQNPQAKTPLTYLWLRGFDEPQR